MDGPFFIDIKEVPKFLPGTVVDAFDRHGGPVVGLVVDLREANKVAIIYTRPEEQ